MKQKKEAQKSRSVLIILLIIFIGLGIVYYLVSTGRLIVFPSDRLFERDVPKRTSAVENPNCIYGEVSKREYFPEYEVKRGDTLLSIAKNQLGDASRENELAVLNRDRYPKLATDKFLEVGYKLYLPDTNLPVSSGNIYIFNRVICSRDGNMITTSEDCTNYGGHTLDNDTVYGGKAKEEFKAGDCVTIVVDSYKSSLLKLTAQ